MGIRVRQADLMITGSKVDLGEYLSTMKLIKKFINRSALGDAKPRKAAGDRDRVWGCFGDVVMSGGLVVVEADGVEDWIGVGVHENGGVRFWRSLEIKQLSKASGGRPMIQLLNLSNSVWYADTVVGVRAIEGGKGELGGPDVEAVGWWCHSVYDGFGFSGISGHECGGVFEVLSQLLPHGVLSFSECGVEFASRNGASVGETNQEGFAFNTGKYLLPLKKSGEDGDGGRVNVGSGVDVRNNKSRFRLSGIKLTDEDVQNMVEQTVIHPVYGVKLYNAYKMWLDEFLLEAKQALGYPLKLSDNLSDDNPAKLGVLGQYVLELAMYEFFMQRYPRESPGPMREMGLWFDWEKVFAAMGLDAVNGLDGTERGYQRLCHSEMDNLDFRELSNEATKFPVKPEFLSSSNRIHLYSPYNLQITCKIGFVNFDPYIEPQSSFNIMSRKAYNSIMKHELVYTWNNMAGFARNLHVFIGGHQFLIDFIILENINEFVEKGLAEVLFGQPFKEHVGIVDDRVNGVLWFKIRDDKTIFNRPRAEKRFGKLTVRQHNTMGPILKISDEDKSRGIHHPYQKKGFYQGCLELGEEYKHDQEVIDWIKGHAT
ncbi:hypothetical protein Tco_0003488 [Tanacetum coccineum]